MMRGQVLLMEWNLIEWNRPSGTIRESNGMQMEPDPIQCDGTRRRTNARANSRAMLGQVLSAWTGMQCNATAALPFSHRRHLCDHCTAVP